MWKDAAPVVVSALVLTAFAAVLILLILRPLTLTDNVADLLKVLVGVLATNSTMVVSYWMGSSSGSKNKDDTIATMATK